MKKRLLWSALVVVAIVLGCVTYVVASVAPKLSSARAALGRDPAELSLADLTSATNDVKDAEQAIDSLPAQILKLIPIARQNLRAVDALSSRAVPALEDAIRLRRLTTTLETEGVIDDGFVRLDLLEELRAVVAPELESLSSVEEVVEEHISGWMLPPVWDEFQTLDDRLATLTASLERGRRALEIAPAMLGGSGSRTYLVMLVNNAELRGAGGILSAVGTLSVDDGKVTLGEFDYQAALARRTPPGKVSLPPDFRRRFARYTTGSGTWINATASPDVPEVADYVAELYERTTNVRSDGALVMDARGLAAMLPPEQLVEVPRSDRAVPAQDLDDYIYSDAYEGVEVQEARREALLSLGPAILETALGQDFTRADMERVGAALRGGHLRVVSFIGDEPSMLDRLEANGDLSDEAMDNLLITVQNLGADKLDFWMRRDVAHRCVIQERQARCQTVVKLRNSAPRGLPLYVVQAKKPYAVYQGYLEIYVPSSAEILAYSLDGEEAELFVEEENGRKSLGTNFRTKRATTTTAVVDYEIPLNGTYSLSITPQPLTRDARVEVVLEAPESWTLSGPSGEAEDSLTWSGTLDETLRFEAIPGRGGRTGIPRFWEWLTEL
jgi:hypothetical protein